MRYSFGRLVLFAAAVAVYLLSWYGLGACFGCPPLFICCLRAVYCCCCSFIIIVLVMYSLGVHFCCCCRSFAVLVMLYHINLLVLSAAAASIYCWLFWRCLLLVWLSGAFGLYYVVWMCLSLKLNINLSEAG
ncbi:hypothetical protein MAM1_1067d11444, partial [Mucor ambiguus]